MKIDQILPDSIGHELGLASGDRIITINGQPVRDPIDFQFLVSDEELEIVVQRNGHQVIYEIEKDVEDDLGIVLPEMKKRLCGADCVFCFVDQNPKGLRESLYVRDEDFRISHIYGNYVTLTNVGPRDLQRIVTQRLSPQYISVHATNSDVRKRLFGIRREDDLLEGLRFLAEADIEIHTQIVLCPGINDGDVLDRTINDLSAFHPQLQTVAIVPLGLTKHRAGLQRLNPVTPAYARRMLEESNVYSRAFRKRFGVGFVYLSDEFYMLAGDAVPERGNYDDFGQLENGVGMVRAFLDDFAEQLSRLPAQIGSPMTLSLVTAMYGGTVLRDTVVPALNAIGNLRVELFPLVNTFYGPSIRVSGLLTGSVIAQGLGDQALGDVVVLPPNCLNHDGVFLDDWTPSRLSETLDRPVVQFTGDFVEMLEACSER